MSNNYENLKDQYDKQFITKQTLRGYVSLQTILPDIGITTEEYEEITGETY